MGISTKSLWELEDSEDNKSVFKFKGLHYKKATVINQGRKFSGERVVMKSRPAEAEDYEPPI